MWLRCFKDAVQTEYYGIVVGNKMDLCPDGSTEEIENWARENQMGFIKTSAKTGENVDSLFQTVLQGAFLVKNCKIFEGQPDNALPQKRKKRCC
jgi:GTPase SAR1 family protein